MEPIKIKFSKVVEEEVNVTLPLYVMDICHAYSVLGEDRAIQVCHGLSHTLSVSVVSVELACKNINSGEYQTRICTELEFLEKYREVMEAIKSKLWKS